MTQQQNASNGFNREVISPDDPSAVGRHWIAYIRSRVRADRDPEEAESRIVTLAWSRWVRTTIPSGHRPDPAAFVRVVCRQAQAEPQREAAGIRALGHGCDALAVRRQPVQGGGMDGLADAQAGEPAAVAIREELYQRIRSRLTGQVERAVLDAIASGATMLAAYHHVRGLTASKREYHRIAQTIRRQTRRALGLAR